MFPVRQAAAGSYYPGNETLAQTKGRSASAKQWRLRDSARSFAFVLPLPIRTPQL